MNFIAAGKMPKHGTGTGRRRRARDETGRVMTYERLKRQTTPP
jgi:hypothetical protein